MSLHFEVHFVDGSYQEFPAKDSVAGEVVRLRRDGFKDREIVETVLGDDWGPPPQVVVLVGTLADGTRVRESLGYK